MTLPLPRNGFHVREPAASKHFLSSGIFALSGLTPRRNAARLACRDASTPLAAFSVVPVAPARSSGTLRLQTEYEVATMTQNIFRRLSVRQSALRVQMDIGEVHRVQLLAMWTVGLVGWRSRP